MKGVQIHKFYNSFKIDFILTYILIQKVFISDKIDFPTKKNIGTKSLILKSGILFLDKSANFRKLNYNSLQVFPRMILFISNLCFSQSAQNKVQKLNTFCVKYCIS